MPFGWRGHGRIPPRRHPVTGSFQFEPTIRSPRRMKQLSNQPLGGYSDSWNTPSGMLHLRLRDSAGLRPASPDEVRPHPMCGALGSQGLVGGGRIGFRCGAPRTYTPTMEFASAVRVVEIP